MGEVLGLGLGGVGHLFSFGYLWLHLESAPQICISVCCWKLVQLGLVRFNLLFVTLASQTQHHTFQVFSQLACIYSKIPKYHVHSGILGSFVFSYLQCWVLRGGFIIFASC